MRSCGPVVKRRAAINLRSVQCCDSEIGQSLRKSIISSVGSDEFRLNLALVECPKMCLASKPIQAYPDRDSENVNPGMRLWNISGGEMRTVRPGFEVENTAIEKSLNCFYWSIRGRCPFEIPGIVAGHICNGDLIAGILFDKYADSLND